MALWNCAPCNLDGYTYNHLDNFRSIIWDMKPNSKKKKITDIQSSFLVNERIPQEFTIDFQKSSLFLECFTKLYNIYNISDYFIIFEELIFRKLNWEQQSKISKWILEFLEWCMTLLKLNLNILKVGNIS